MVDWANLRWWFPILWPNDKAKPNPDPEAELGPLRTDLDSERLLQMLTVAQDLKAVLLQRRTALQEWQKDLEAREKAVRGLWEDLAFGNRSHAVVTKRGSTT
ncbi:hypothetical protein BDV40DRAFT_300446 [Aspergillus tamarii]|uniref:Uncharacterized protein n=1 Tax=Aspergillus tamarii TaxID=41984 RepID=A0A5N6UUT4_ASPTM|nr:hypothetical protein BDV40DRAFT_300446 [Aspergillus tamarii]